MFSLKAESFRKKFFSFHFLPPIHPENIEQIEVVSTIELNIRQNFKIRELHVKIDNKISRKLKEWRVLAKND